MSERVVTTQAELDAAPLARNGYWMPLTIAALVGILVWDRGWFWFMLLAAAIGVGPWFACARLLDRIGDLEVDIVRLAGELTTSNARLAGALDEHALCPTPLVPFDSLSKPERDHIKAAASKITAASLRPDLRIVEAPPVADESWLDEITRPGGWGDGSAS